MSRMGRKARKERENALKKAIAEVLSHDALEETDLYYAIDELTAGDETLDHLAKAAAEIRYAERELGHRGLRQLSDHSPSLAVVDALDGYAEQLVRANIRDAEEWLDGDVTLDDLRGETA